MGWTLLASHVSRIPKSDWKSHGDLGLTHAWNKHETSTLKVGTICSYVFQVDNNFLGPQQRPWQCWKVLKHTMFSNRLVFVLSLQNGWYHLISRHPHKKGHKLLKLKEERTPFLLAELPSTELGQTLSAHRLTFLLFFRGEAVRQSRSYVLPLHSVLVVPYKL